MRVSGFINEAEVENYLLGLHMTPTLNDFGTATPNKKEKVED